MRELPSLRTARSDTYERSDGTRVSRIYDEPVNYQTPSSGWHPISSAGLQPGGAQALQASTSASLPVALPRSLSSPITVGASGAVVSFALRGGAGTAVHSGARVVYPNVRPGVSAAYEQEPTRLKETLSLASASAPSVYTYRLSTSGGLRPRLLGGSVIFFDSSGQPRYVMPAPTVAGDGEHAALPDTRDIRYELRDRGTTLRVVLDRSWLQSPSRRFPVTVDPTVEMWNEYGDCAIANEGYENTSLCGGSLYTGGPHATARSLLLFELGSAIPQNAVVLDSTLSLELKADSTENTQTIDALPLSPHTPAVGVTWKDYDGTHAWTHAGGDFVSAPESQATVSPESVGHSVSWDVTKMVEGWLRNPSSNHGLILKDAAEETEALDEFYGHESENQPTLEVIWANKLGSPHNSQAIVHQSTGNGGEIGVNVADGDLFVTDPDVRYEGAGYTTALTRVYNSLDDESVGSAFGGHWHLSAGEDELIYPLGPSGAYAVHGPDGSWHRFERDPAGDGHPAEGDLVYTEQRATEEGEAPETLVVHSDGTRTLSYNENGTEWVFDNSGNGFPQKIVEPGEGEPSNTLDLTYYLSHLTKVEDSHEHTIEISRHEGTGYIETIHAGDEEWVYHHDEAGQLTSYSGPGGQEAEYGYYATNHLLHYIKDPSGTYVFAYDEQERVTELRKVVNGTVETVGSEDEVTSFKYVSPESAYCESGRDAAQTVVENPGGESETETFCLNSAGEITEDFGRTADGGESSPEGEGFSDELEFVPFDDADHAIRSRVKPALETITTHFKYNDTLDSEYEKRDEYGGLFIGVAYFEHKPPHYLNWGYEFGEYLQGIARSNVTELASAYTLPRKRKINYSDDHFEPAWYRFHSFVPVYEGQEYQLAVNFEFICEKEEGLGKCTLLLRHDFSLKKSPVE